MKTTFLLRDDLAQVVLTPETKHESTLLGMLHEGDRDVAVYRGNFEECKAGYVREFGLGGTFSSGSPLTQPDTVLVLRPRAETPAPPLYTDAHPESDLCKLRDGTWVYRNHAGVWQTCPPPFPPDKTYEVQQLKAELRIIRDQYVLHRGDMTNRSALDAIATICNNALGDDK